MRRKRVCCGAVCVLLVLACLMGCGAKKETAEPPTSVEPGTINVQEPTAAPVEDPADPAEEKPADPAQTEESVPESGEAEEAAPEEVPEEPEIVNPDIVIVKTPYGDLMYQEQWAEFMRTEQMEEGELLHVRFLAAFGETNYPLFTAVIGGGEEDAVAKLTGPDGTQRNVAMLMEEIMGLESLSDEELNRLYAMQEEINYVIQNIK